MSSTVTITPEIGLGFGSIKAEPLTDEKAQSFAETVAQFRRDINRSAPAVCIDGRRLLPGENPLELGAHIAGGGMTLLVGARAAGHPFDGEELFDYAQQQGFTLGAHCDSGNKAADFADGTGCGANDKYPQIKRNFDENKEAIKGVTSQLLGEHFNESVFVELKLPKADESTWDKNSLINIVGAENTETLETTHEGVHGHKEAMVIFNTVSNTTIDRDALVEATGKQVFVVDLWYIKELAQKLATGPDAVNQAAMMEHAMVAYQVATYITLCDGSHRAAVMS